MITYYSSDSEHSWPVSFCHNWYGIAEPAILVAQLSLALDSVGGRTRGAWDSTIVARFSFAFDASAGEEGIA